MAVLLGDIGGTNARFRWLEKDKLSSLFEYKCADFKSPKALIEKVLKDFPKKLTGIVVAGAGPVKNGKISWTNIKNWKLSERELQKNYRLKNVMIVNDVQAQGEGLKTLHNCANPTILMTAGTGLGACFIFNNQVIPGEIGQVNVQDKSKLEDFISGPGIVNLYHSLGGNKKIHSARKIEELKKKEKEANLAFQKFYQMWGKISAQLVTAFNATGGIYLWGGLIPTDKKDKLLLTKTYKKMLPKTFQRISIRFVKDKSLAFKGLSSLSHHKFD